ncbi:MAG: hypothetical protein NTV34_02730 [Proteobacteria bacterium]|nr:hypothetical protein [Pseudomonadota bacterium]
MHKASFYFVHVQCILLFSFWAATFTSCKSTEVDSLSKDLIEYSDLNGHSISIHKAFALRISSNSEKIIKLREPNLIKTSLCPSSLGMGAKASLKFQNTTIKAEDGPKFSTPFMLVSQTGRVKISSVTKQSNPVKIIVETAGSGGIPSGYTIEFEDLKCFGPNSIVDPDLLSGPPNAVMSLIQDFLRALPLSYEDSVWSHDDQLARSTNVPEIVSNMKKMTFKFSDSRNLPLRRTGDSLECPRTDLEIKRNSPRLTIEYVGAGSVQDVKTDPSITYQINDITEGNKSTLKVYDNNSTLANFVFWTDRSVYEGSSVIGSESSYPSQLENSFRGALRGCSIIKLDEGLARP